VISIRGQFLGPKGKTIEEYDYLELGRKYRLLPKAEVQLSTLDGKETYIIVGPGLLLFDSQGSVSLNGKTLKPKFQQPLFQNVADSKVSSRKQAGLPFRGIQVVTRTADGQTKILPLYSGYHALVVGVSHYDMWPDLPNAVKDAKEVAKKLKKMGFEVKLVLDPTYRDLKRSLNKMVYNMGGEADRAILFFYAGHGETETLADGTKMGYIIPRDCPVLEKNRLGFATYAISMRDIESASLRTRSKHVLMLFDSCFSGALFTLGRAVPHDITEKSTLPVRQYITAGREDENVPDQSMFKRCLLIGLDGDADLTGDGYITGSELGMYLSDKVVNYTRRNQHPQYGKINNPDLDRGDFIFVPLKLSQKKDEKTLKRHKEQLVITEKPIRVQEEKGKNEEFLAHMKRVQKTKSQSEEKEMLAEKKGLDERLKLAEIQNQSDRDAIAARLKKLEAKLLATEEKEIKEAQEKKDLETQLKKIKAEEKKDVESIEDLNTVETHDKKLVYITKGRKRLYDEYRYGRGSSVIDDFEDKDLFSENCNAKWRGLAKGQASVNISADPTQGANGTSCSMKIEYELGERASVKVYPGGNPFPITFEERLKRRINIYDHYRPDNNQAISICYMACERQKWYFGKRKLCKTCSNYRYWMSYLWLQKSNKLSCLSSIGLT